MAGTYKTFSEYTEAIPWTVRVVREGDSYGLNMMLVHDGKPMVEFYDTKYAGKEGFARTGSSFPGIS